MNPKLKQASQLDRVPKRMFAEGEPDNTDTPEGISDPAGGMFGAGLLPRVSLCTRGEALGHGFWVDSVMLQQIAELATAAGRIKSRFTHPDLCADGTGKALGTIDGVSAEGDQVYGDLSFYKAAHKAPDGDLAGYVMKLADEDPEAFGLSIVFRHDWEAEEQFEEDNTEEVELTDEEGNVVDVRYKFVSPDPLNVDHLPHARILELYAADVVDEPAANPNGLFHRQNKLAIEGRSVLDYVLGRSTEAPKLSALGVAPERVKEFVTRYLADAGLSLKELEEMPKLKTSLTKPAKKLAVKLADKPACEDEEKKDGASDEESKDATEEGEDDEEEKKDAAEEEDPPKEEEPKSDDDDEDGMRSGLAQFCQMFGNDRGASYFLKGMDFTEALQAEVLTLRTQLADANKKLESFANLGVDPVKFQAVPDKSAPAGGTTSEEVAPSNREKFAQLNKAKGTVPKK